MMDIKILSIFCVVLIALIESNASPQITKFAPVEDWLEFKQRTGNIKPLDKFLGKLRATYDFVFHKPENVSNVEKILSRDKVETGPYKFILPENSQLPDKDNVEQVTENVYVELLPDEPKESSISRVATDWADEPEEEEAEPLGELEIISDNDNIDRSVESVPGGNSNFELPAAVARAFIRWLSSIIGFTQGAYLKITNSTRGA